MLIIPVTGHKNLDSRLVHVDLEQMGLSVGQNVAGSKLGLVLGIVSGGDVAQAAVEEPVEVCGALDELGVEISVAEFHASGLGGFPSLLEGVGVKEFEGHELVQSGWEGEGQSVELVLDPGNESKGKFSYTKVTWMTWVMCLKSTKSMTISCFIWAFEVRAPLAISGLSFKP